LEKAVKERKAAKEEKVEPPIELHH
jgi:hypothetical protein